MDQTTGSQSDLGMEYQYKVATFIAAHLSQNKNVEDFVIHTNLKDAGKFDDVIASVKFKGKIQQYVYSIQVKHTSKDKGAKLNNLHEYADSFDKIMVSDHLKFREGVPNENMHFWYFCSKGVAEPIQLLMRRDASKLYLQKRSQSPAASESIVPFDDRCYKLYSSQPSGRFYYDFFDKFYLFLNQPNNAEIVNDIGRICDIREAMEIIRYVQEYFKVPDLHRNGLSKKVFEVELLRIHLSNYILTPTRKIDMDSDQSSVWNRITLGHDVTIINDEKDIEHRVFGCLSQQIDQLLNGPVQWNICVQDGGNLNEQVINEFMRVSRRSQSRHWISVPNILKSLLVELWVLGALPLVLKTNGELSVLKKYQHLKQKIIIIDDLKKRREEISSFGLKTFAHTGDINMIELRDELLERILISLQGRKPTSLLSVVSDEGKLMESLSCSLILHLMKRRREYLREECFDETSLLIFLIENENSQDNVRIDDVRVTDDANIKIYCKRSEVEVCSKQIREESKFKSHSLCHLREVDDKLVLIEGDKSKLRNFFVDEYGDEIYSLQGDGAVAVVGRRLANNEAIYMRRNLNKAILEISCFDKSEKALYLLSGEVDTLNSTIASQVIRGPVDYMESCAKLYLGNNKNALINVDGGSAKEFWEKFSCLGYAMFHVIVKNGQMQIAKCKNCGSLSSSISYNSDSFGEQDFFAEIKNGISLVSGTPGAGKSTLLSSLSSKYNEKDYVLFCNLIDYRQDLRGHSRGVNEAPLNFIFRKVDYGKGRKRYSQFLRSLCEYHANSGRLALFVDSFDEVLSVCKEEVLEFIKSIAKNTNIKIIIASRFIADSLIVNDFEIQPFEIADLEEEAVEEYIRKETSIDLSDLPVPVDFLKTPLYLSFLMILKIESLDTLFEIDRLHERIVEKKLERYFRKKKDFYTRSKYLREDVLRVHKFLALATIFGKEIVSDQGLDYDDLVNECIETDKIKLGLISRFSDNYPVFIHQTFVEFLIIDWFSTNITHPLSTKVYEYILTKCDLTLRYYFNKSMCKDLQLHTAILNRNVSSVIALCNEEELRKVDKCNRPPLLLAAYIGHRFTVDIILRHMVKYQVDLNARDPFIGWNWVEYVENVNKQYFEIACKCGLTTTIKTYLDVTQRTITDEDILMTIKYEQMETALVLLDKNKPLMHKYFKRITLQSINLSRLDILYDITRILYWANGKFQILHKACQNLHPISPDCINFVTRNGLTAVHLASISGNWDIVKKLLDLGVDPNVADDFQRTPMHYNAIQGSVAVAHLLVERTTNLNGKDIGDNTPLHLAVEFSNLDVVEVLLKKNVDLNLRNNHLYTPLHIAAGKACNNIIRKLLEYGAEVNCPTHAGTIPLEIAARQDMKGNVKLLLENGANPNCINADGESFLQHKLRYCQSEVVQILIDGGADITYVNNDGGNILHTALQKYGVNLIEVLIEKGANVNLVDYNGISVLEWAIINYDYIQEVLLEKGAMLNAEGIYALTAVYNTKTEKHRLRNISDAPVKLIEKDKLTLLQCNMSKFYESLKSSNVTDMKGIFNSDFNINRTGEEGLTLLQFAVRNDDLDFAKILLEMGADINRRATNGRRALHFAVQSGNSGMTGMLLRNGANPDLVDADGMSALFAAVRMGHVDITRTILENGASIDSCDIHGSTALHVATRRNNAAVAKVLLENEACATIIDKYGIAALDLASKSQNREIEQLLSDRGAKVRCKHKHFKWNDLHRAVEWDEMELARALLEQSVIDIDERDYRGKAVLHTAVENNNEDMVEMLLKHGADAEVRDRGCGSETALLKAIKYNNTKMVKLLLGWGADVDLKYPLLPLFQAVNNNNITITKLLLERNAYVNPIYVPEVNPLHCAYLHRNVEMVKLLRGNGGYITGEEYRKTSLCEAVERNDRNQVEELILKGADVNVRNDRSWTLLHIAIKNDNKNILKLLLSNGANANLKDAKNHTLLYTAIKRNNVDFVKILLEYNADPNRRSKYDFTALHFATKSNSLEIVEVLLEKGCDVNRKTLKGCTALHLATSSNNLSILNLLAKHHANINKQTDIGLTCLHIASQNNNVDIINVLLAAGADANLLTDCGLSALHLAAENNNMNAISALLENGADPNLQDNTNSTILHISIRNGKVVLLKLLLEKGVDISISNSDGLTALHIAVQQNNFEMVDALLHHGADVNAKDVNGNTALHLRAMEHDIMNVEEYAGDEIMDALLRHGGDPLILNDGNKSLVDILEVFGFNTLPIMMRVKINLV